MVTDRRHCWALRNPETGVIALSTIVHSRSEVDALLARQLVHQPHIKATEPVEVVVTLAAKPVGR